MKEIIIRQTEAGQRLDKFLNRCLPGAGKSFLYKMLRKKNIVLNGKKTAGNELLNDGDSIKLFFSEETFQKFASEKPAETYPVLEKQYILYENDQMLAINKPAGMLSQKAAQDDQSLVEYLTGYFLKEGVVAKEGLHLFSPGICNRLDRNTSGIVLAGKNLAAARGLSDMFRQRTMKKFYLALVKGTIAKPEKIAGYLVKNSMTNTVTVSDLPQEESAYIETRYEPLGYSDGCTLLKVELITGRTHQIRSHLAHIGHPIAGDGKYGDRTLNQKLKTECGLKRQFLHAWQIEFPPMEGILEALSGETITAEPSKDLQRVLCHLRLRGEIK